LVAFVKNWGVAALVGVLSGLVGALAIALFVGLVPLQPNSNSVGPNAVVSSQTPALDHLDTLRCPRGLQSVVEVRGQEDGFSKAGIEPSRVDPAMLRFGLFADYEARRPRAIGRRDYDEGGVDRAFVDYFKIPEGAVSAVLVFRLRGIGSAAQNDSIQLIPQASYKSSRGVDRLAVFGSGITDPIFVPVGDKANGVYQWALDAMTLPAPEPRTRFFDYINANPASASDSASSHVSLMISDDSQVDMAAISWCVEPSQARGVTFVEHSDKMLGEDVSFLSCSSDPTQSSCDPFSGDTLCTSALPLACFKAGNQAKPERLKALSQGSYFNSGQVQLTSPIAGSTFKTRLEADEFCASQFGQGWRVLQYADGTAASVVTVSQIAPRTRAWVEIGDQPRGRCWDRPKDGARSTPK
jgi:hypothetical protein